MICGQTTLKHWVLLLPVQILTMISATESLHVSRVFLLTALKMPQELLINEPLQYEEVAKVCSRLKRGISDVLIDYEHVLFACPPLWKHLFLFVSRVLPKGLNLFDFENWNYLTSFQR